MGRCGHCVLADAGTLPLDRAAAASGGRSGRNENDRLLRLQEVLRLEDQLVWNAGLCVRSVERKVQADRTNCGRNHGSSWNRGSRSEALSHGHPVLYSRLWLGHRPRHWRRDQRQPPRPLFLSPPLWRKVGRSASPRQSVVSEKIVELRMFFMIADFPGSAYRANDRDDGPEWR